MHQPVKVDLSKKELMGIDELRFFYTTDVKDINDTRFVGDDNVVFFDQKNDDINANIGLGIFSVYEVMVTQDPLKCWFCENLCVCADCMDVN